MIGEMGDGQGYELCELPVKEKHFTYELHDGRQF